MQPSGRPESSQQRQAIPLPVDYVAPVGLALVVAHLLFRTWALSENWFFYDDYYLIQEGASPSALSELLQPYNGHLMPGARLVAWLLAENGGLVWGLAGAVTLAIQAAAAGGALWMLLTLFGRRWGVLVPLALYLSTAFTMPSMIWWSVAVTALPTQVAFLWGVGCWVQYLRTLAGVWLVATIGAVGFGLFFDVRGILVVPVLVFITLAYFSSGSFVTRLGGLIRVWPGVLVGGAVSLAYVVAYRTYVPQPFNESSWSTLGAMATNMVTRAIPAGLLGGPWVWRDDLLVASPPAWVAWTSTALVLAVPVVVWLRRHRTLRAWVPTVFLVVTILVLVSMSRAPVLGTVLGLDYRFFAEVSCAVVLGIGLACMELQGATESSVPRSAPRPRVMPPVWLTGALAGTVVASGLYSGTSYALTFSERNASHEFFDAAVADIDRFGNIDLVDQPLSPQVMDTLFYPFNTTSNLLPMMTEHARFPRSTQLLAALGDDGHLRTARVTDSVVSRPGPQEGCGWRVTSPGRTIPLTARAFEYSWWLKIGYLSSRDSPLRVTAGDTTVDAMVLAGLNNLYVQVDGGFDSIRLDGVAGDTTVCVDNIVVGRAEPGDPL